MAGEYSGSRSSNTQLLAELEALSENLYQKPQVSVGNRRTNSLALPRSSVPSLVTSADEVSTARAEDLTVSKPRARRLSLSPWRSRPKLEVEEEENVTQSNRIVKKPEESSSGSGVKEEKKGIWNWKPIRGLVRIGMQKLSCLLSVEVVAAQNLPASMNGLRLGVCVRKKETKDGAVQTMPCRVSQGSADFEETLFIKCHVYYSPANGKGSPAKFEARPFLFYLFAVDAKELEFGRHVVDLSELIQESVEKMNYEGARVRQWDMNWGLSGKAKGGELALKLGFQIMEKDGGAGIYSKQGEFGMKPSSKPKNFANSFGRKQSKTSFSVPSPKMTSRSAETHPLPTLVSSWFLSTGRSVHPVSHIRLYRVWFWPQYICKAHSAVARARLGVFNLSVIAAHFAPCMPLSTSQLYIYPLLTAAPPAVGATHHAVES